MTRTFSCLFSSVLSHFSVRVSVDQGSHYETVIHCFEQTFIAQIVPQKVANWQYSFL